MRYQITLQVVDLQGFFCIFVSHCLAASLKKGGIKVGTMSYGWCEKVGMTVEGVMTC
jgi:hypothetical protein